jgi:prepilin-type N-terminal cleavage/methylation domain-containing protein
MLRNQKGFTLVELVIVIVIIGILAAIAIPKFADLSDNAKAATCKQNQANVESAATIGYSNRAISGTASYPATVAEMVTVDLLLPADLACPETGDYSSYEAGYDNTAGTCTCGLSSGTAVHAK